MAPPEGGTGKPRRPRQKRPADPIREAAANGHAEWVDSTPAESWDPWGETDADGEETAASRGLDRTLGEWLEAVVPPEAQVHFLAAGAEFVAGVQSTIEYHQRGRVSPDDDDDAHPVRIEIE